MRNVPDWFPGASFKATAKSYRKTTVKLRDEPYKQVKEQVVRVPPVTPSHPLIGPKAKGIAPPSFTAALIEGHPNATPEQEDILKWASTAFYSGVSSTLYKFGNGYKCSNLL